MRLIRGRSRIEALPHQPLIRETQSPASHQADPATHLNAQFRITYDCCVQDAGAV